MMGSKILLKRILLEIILNSKRTYKIRKNLKMMRVYFWTATKFRMRGLHQSWYEQMFKSNKSYQVDKKMIKKLMRPRQNLKESFNFNYCPI